MVGDTSHTFTAGVWNIRIVKDGEDVKPSLAVQVKKFSKGQGKTFFFPFCLIWIFTHIEKCQGHHTRETIAIHHFTSNRLRLHRRVNAEWPPNSSCSSSAVRRLKFSRLSVFKSLSLVGDQTWPKRQRHWFITLPCRPNDPSRCHRHVPTSFRGAFKARRVQLGTLWIADWMCLSLLTVCKRRGEKNCQMPFRDVMGESLGVVLSSLTVCLQRELIDGWADCCFAKTHMNMLSRGMGGNDCFLRTRCSADWREEKTRQDLQKNVLTLAWLIWLKN